MKRAGGIVLIVAVAVTVAYVWLRPRPQGLSEAYVGERAATVWNSLAQVRAPVATLRFGDRVTVVERRGDQAHIRLPGGTTGWLEARLLLAPALWERSAKLLNETRKMPLQAAGHTKVPTNVRIDPGRTAARIFQFGRDVPVEIFARAVAEWSPAGEEPGREASGDAEKSRREDWLLVRGVVPAEVGGTVTPGEGAPPPAATVVPAITVAGWVVARFVELDLPDTIKNYASSAGIHVLAWFELNRVREAPGSSEQKPQYLVAGWRGGEGQGCDFTMLRVYTWGAGRQRYETAFVESNLCGSLPIRVGKSPAGEPEFHFETAGAKGEEERIYRMRQTTVRRVREAVKTRSRAKK